MKINIFNLKRLKNYVLIRRGFNKSIRLGSRLLNFPLMDAPIIKTDINYIDYSRFNEEFCDFIRNFEKTLKEKLNDINLSIFYYNINKLTIKKVESDPKVRFNNDKNSPLIECDGLYISNSKNKTIYYKDEEALSHEGLHMATSIEINDKYWSGFEQVISLNDKTIIIGTGLNEGYTELLNQKYFLKRDSDAYQLTTSFVKILEKIIGSNIMEKLYFNADLKGLIKELEKYNSIDNIIAFIYALDKVNGFESMYDELDEEGEKYAQYYFRLAVRYMSNFLVSTCINKINYEKNNNNKDVKRLIDILISIFNELGYDNKNYLKLSNTIKYAFKIKKLKN